jgi:hypothetical protein
VTGWSSRLTTRVATQRAIPAVTGSSAPLVVYAATAFWCATLVFAVQPMVVRMVVPMVGGAPAVWLVSLVFFQSALLAGYAYAHLSQRWLRPTTQVRLHLGLFVLAVATLPIGLPSSWMQPGSMPAALFVFGVLTVAVAAPFVVAVATGPLLHVWYGQTRGRRSDDPYVLFAASNAGSLLGLLAYPTIVEPRLGLATQAWWWAAGFVGLLVLVAACGRLRGTAGATLDSGRNSPVVASVAAMPGGRLRSRLEWVGCALAGSALLMAVTAHLTRDVAAAPLLWVLPLAVYLSSFVVVFSPRRRPALGPVGAAFVLVVAILIVVDRWSVAVPTWADFTLHLLVLGAGAVVAHGRLAQTRPAAAQATGFLLWVAAGGVLGGLLVALVAPLLVASPVEYPLAIAAVLLTRRGPADGSTTPALTQAVGLALVALWATGRLLPAAATVSGWIGGALVAVIVAGVVLCIVVVAARPAVLAILAAVLLVPGLLPSGTVLHHGRTFFGSHMVTVNAAGHHVLVHGTTIHGSQDPRRPSEPVGYYHPDGPIGDLFAYLNETGRLRDAQVAGLGAGVLAAYGLPSQTFTFHEIDPDIGAIAADPDLFTYLRDSRARVEIKLGDARLGIASAPAGSVDLVVLDAFTSNAVPTHLLTSEAVAEYQRVLRDDGLLLVNISNRHVDLEPVLGAVAADLDLVAVTAHDDGGGSHVLSSSWVLMARNPEALPTLAGWSSTRRDGTRAWTDDFSSLWSVLDWR